MLCLRTIPHTREPSYDQLAAVGNASPTLSALLEWHSCIDEVNFTYNTPSRIYDLAIKPSKLIRLSRSVRHVTVSLRSSESCSPFQVVDVCSLATLETLVFEGFDISSDAGSKIASTLSRNAHTLRKVVIKCARMSLESSDLLWRSLQGCVRLKSASLSYTCFPGNVDEFVCFVQSSQTLQRVMVPILTRARDVTQVVRALWMSTSLQEVYICDASILTMAPVFTALRFHSRIKFLHLVKYTIFRIQGTSVASMLRSNKVLQTLIIERGSLSICGAEELARGIRDNSTLQCLEFLSSSISTAAICCLCKALDHNKTLKRLKFDKYYASNSERASLAAVLESSSSYDRVLIPLADADMKSILSHHTKAQLFLTELSLDNICDISSVLLKELCEILAVSFTVKTLKVYYGGHERDKIDLFSAMLKDNKSITSLEISLHSHLGCCHLAEKVTAALIHNTTLQELNVCFACKCFSSLTAKFFCHMLSKNQALCKVFIKIFHQLSNESLELLSTGVQHSKVLLEFGTGEVKIPLSCITYPMFRTLQQNNSRLNKAIMFVQHSRNRQCAIAFEYLCRKPHFVSYVAKATGQSMSEATQNIRSAQHYLFDNYFVIAGIVRHSVQCYPGQGTQIDALNADIWRVIAQYVKLSDIYV